MLAVTLVALYVVSPTLLSMLSAWPELLTIHPGWVVVMLAAEAGSFACMWGLQRLALRTTRWFDIATSQLAGNAVSRIVPGGAAAGAALQFRMLVEAGIRRENAGTGLTASSLVAIAILLLLPILSIPAALAGRPIPSGLSEAALLGGVVFVLIASAGAVFLFTDGPLRWLGRTIERLRMMVRPRGIRRSDLPDRLLHERDHVRRVVGSSWWKTVLFAVGNPLLDYLALLAALRAVGSSPRPSLVLLAYVGARVLGLIPITPGGVGFVEAGLTGLLALAGVSAADAILATLAYRLGSYWLPLPAGLVAMGLHGRRQRRRRPAVAD
jgi:hypothetical protein